MTPNEAKRDVAQRIAAVGLTYAKLSAKTVSFADLARSAPVFVTVHGLQGCTPEAFARITDNLRRPSDGGYILRIE